MERSELEELLDDLISLASEVKKVGNYVYAFELYMDALFLAYYMRDKKKSELICDELRELKEYLPK